MQEQKFCHQCGTRLKYQQSGGRNLLACTRCSTIIYANPKLAVAIAVEIDGKLLLQRRAIQPGIGLWSFPSGYVDQGEVVEEAAVREVREETGIDVTIDKLVGLYSHAGNPVVLAVYAGYAPGQIPNVNDAEVREVGLFFPDKLPPLAFPHDVCIIDDWKILRESHRETN